MLFNSYEFIFVFLPFTFFIFAFSKLWKKFVVPIVVLCLLSIVFYGYWNYRYTILIITSIFVNYCIGVWLSNSNISGNLKKTAFIIGVTFNLSLLAYFKYSGFIGNILYDIGVISLTQENVVLPLAISFFTFQQISYLADIYHSRNDQVSLSKYFLFVAFFPQLIAGPIVYFHEIIPQFGRRLTSKTKLIDLQVGIWIFSVGLFKKVIIADTLSMDVDDIFFWSYKGIHPTIFEAWIGALGYTFQIYFDFSGYSDMAVGLARLFGIRLPLNFFSPYKATNIIDFWRRWHITLSRFLRDYLYIPLGGNRKGPVRRYANILVTMLLGGLWHGAGATFVVWGGIHGLYIAINHLWRRFHPGKFPRWMGGAIGARLITLMGIVFSWVLFRAEDFETARIIWGSMLFENGVSLPSRWEHAMSSLAFLGDFLIFDGPFHNGMISYHARTVSFIVLAAIVTLVAPNVYQMTQRFRPVVQSELPVPATARNLMGLSWQPSVIWGVITGLLFGLSVVSISTAREFLYFQF